MSALLKSISRLKPLTQVAVIMGLLILLVIVAFNPVAGASMISFLAALVSLQSKGGDNNNTKDG